MNRDGCGVQKLSILVQSVLSILTEYMGFEGVVNFYSSRSHCILTSEELKCRLSASVQFSGPNTIPRPGCSEVAIQPQILSNLNESLHHIGNPVTNQTGDLWGVLQCGNRLSKAVAER